MHSSAKYCPNANNSVKKWLFLKKQASLSSIPKSAFLDIKFIRHFYHVIWVEKTHKSDIPFYGSPCTFFYLFFLILFHLFTFLSYLLVVFLLIMYCGICTNRKWNFEFVCLFLFIFVSCSQNFVKVRLTFFCLKYILKNINDINLGTNPLTYIVQVMLFEILLL